MADEMTTRDVARRLGVSKVTVIRLVKREELKAAGELGNLLYFDRDYIELFAATYRPGKPGRKPARKVAA